MLIKLDIIIFFNEKLPNKTFIIGTIVPVSNVNNNIYFIKLLLMDFAALWSIYNIKQIDNQEYKYQYIILTLSSEVA